MRNRAMLRMLSAAVMWATTAGIVAKLRMARSLARPLRKRAAKRANASSDNTEKNGAPHCRIVKRESDVYRSTKPYTIKPKGG